MRALPSPFFPPLSLTPSQEKYFVPGGFALSHENSVTDITCPDAVPVDDLDASSIASQFADAKKAFESAEAGSQNAAMAQIDMDVCRAMAGAVGITVA